MSEAHYTFSVLQYRHDAWTGEALNVGVLLSAPDVGFLKMKVTTNPSRLKQAYPDLDTERLQKLLKAVEISVSSFAKEIKQGSSSSDQLTSSSIARKMLPEDDSALRWLEPGAGTTSAPQEELDRLFSRYVGRWEHGPTSNMAFDDSLIELRQQKLDNRFKWILRAIYYKQNLPEKVLAEGSFAVKRRMEILELSGLITKAPEGPRLTASGVRALKKAYGTSRPPLVDFKEDARLPRKEQKKEFIVGSSLASAIAREVSGGE